MPVGCPLSFERVDWSGVVKGFFSPSLASLVSKDRPCSAEGFRARLEMCFESEGLRRCLCRYDWELGERGRLGLAQWLWLSTSWVCVAVRDEVVVAVVVELDRLRGGVWAWEATGDRCDGGV